MPRYRQEVINVRIADLLKKAGFKEATAELVTEGGLPDVMINVSGVRVVLEGWFERSVSVGVLREKCKKRIEDGICDVAIGVFYPETLKEAESDEELIDKVKQSYYEVFVFYLSEKEETVEVVEQALGKVKLEQLAEYFRYLYAQIVKTDLLKKEVVKIEKAIQACAETASITSLFYSSEKVIKGLKSALGIEDEAERKAPSFKEDLTKMAIFIIFNGLLFHQVLSSRHYQINGLEKAPDLNLLGFVKKEWEKIMKINYLPIFTLAFEIVNCLPVSPETDEIFKTLKPIVFEVISSRVLLKHDLMGRVYHKLLLNTTGEYYASYYTSIPAATLLSNLTVKTENPDLEWDFSDLEKLKKLKIVDPACGSGTLLSGIYAALKNEYVLAHYRNENGKSRKLDLSLFHKVMIEDVLQGWDVLDYAGHLTLTTLALHNPDGLFDHCNIYTLLSGKGENDVIYLGSLSLLEKGQTSIPFKEFTMPLTEKSLKAERKVYFKILPNSVDVVIMNPPFSRSAGKVNVKFGYTEEEVRKQMNQKLKKLGESFGYKRVGHAGLGAYFVILADNLLKQGGRLALVIPRAILSGVSWKEIRDLLVKNYEVEYVVSNYDPGDKELGVEPWNWSENTDLGEVLIVARKTNKPLEERFTTFINLWNKPANELEALKVVSDSIRVRKKFSEYLLEKGRYEVLKLEKEKGVVYNVPQRLLTRSFLTFCLFANPELNKLVFSLTYTPPFGLVPLINLVLEDRKLGVDRKEIRETFESTDVITPYKVLWGTSVSMNELCLDSSYVRYGRLKKKDDSIYECAANLLIAENLHLKTESLTATYSEEKVLATTFWEIRLDPQTSKLLTLWLNSTFGFLILLSNSINSQGDRFIIKKGHLVSLPVIDVSLLTKKQKETLLELYENLKNEPFMPFPEEFKLASEGKGVRKQIDDAFIKLLNLKLDLQPYYETLAKEPILTLERW